ncbi:hypothetical protein H4582DRAFT_2205384 [Lactarius indigo]|nr:hypothetical protein H4582DRAFT_2205384 [Lactarius indigo]
MPYSLSIDLSGVAAEEETLELENAPTRRSDTIEVEAPIGRDAFVLGKTLEPHQSEEGANDTTMVDDIPGWVARRRLTRQSRTIEAEAPTRGDAFIPSKAPGPEKMLINDHDSGEPEWVAKRRTTRSHAPPMPTAEPDNKGNIPGSPEWTTVSYKKTTGHRANPIDRRHKHEMTRSRNEPEKSRSGRPRWRRSPEPEISPQAPGMDTGGDQRTRKLDRNPISRSPSKGDAREFAERSRMLLQMLRSNPEFAALPRDEQRSLLTELIEDNENRCESKEGDLQTQSEGNDNWEGNDDWQANDKLQKNEAVDDDSERKSRSPCIDHTCGDASIERSRSLLRVLQENPAFTGLPRSEQRLVFAELLENEEECAYLLTLKEEGSYNDAECVLTEEGNEPSRRNSDEQQWPPEPERNDYWTDEPEDDTSLGTVDYWAQLIKNLSREESNEFLDDLLEGITDDLPDDTFNESTWEKAAVQLPDSSYMSDSTNLAQNNDEGAPPSVTLNQEQLTEGTSTTDDEELKPLYGPRQYEEGSDEQQQTQKAQYEKRRQRRRAAKATPWDMVECRWNTEATERTAIPKTKTTKETEPAAIIIATDDPPIPENERNNPGRNQNDHREVPRGCSNPKTTETNTSG